MKFVETPIFTKRLNEMMSDEDYRKLQTALALRPEQGDLIKGGRGLRKIRWGGKHQGKRGGLRVIYYWDVKNETIFMLLVYPKTAQSELTPEQQKILSRLVMEGLE